MRSYAGPVNFSDESDPKIVGSTITSSQKVITRAMNSAQRRNLADRLAALKSLMDEKASYESELSAAQSNVAGCCACYQSREMLRLTTFRDEAELKLQDVERRLGEAKGALRAAVDRDLLTEVTALLDG